MEPESPSPYTQVPATCPYPEPTPSSPHDPLQYYELFVFFFFLSLRWVHNKLKTSFSQEYWTFRETINKNKS
jgi:hypothetical protein